MSQCVFVSKNKSTFLKNQWHTRIRPFNIKQNGAPIRIKIKGSLKAERAVRLPFNNVTAIPEEATSNFTF